MFRFVFWDVMPCKIIVDRRLKVRSASIIREIALLMEAARTSETSVDNCFTRQYIPEDKSELHTRRHENFKSHIFEDASSCIKSLHKLHKVKVDCGIRV
jgi:hypothetical protein